MSSFEDEYRRQLNQLKRLSKEIFDISEKTGKEIDGASKREIQFYLEILGNEGVLKNADNEDLKALKLTNMMLESLISDIKSDLRYVGPEKINVPQKDDLEEYVVMIPNMAGLEDYIIMEMNDFISSLDSEQQQKLFGEAPKKEKTYDFESETVSIDKVLKTPKNNAEKDKGQSIENDDDNDLDR